jgi:Asp-tRNA(Asn)/Glu-tRNA(Gln) amidotransferase A subunit family amidase
VAALESAASDLQARGAVIEELPVPSGFAELSEARVIINGYERARALAWESSHHADQISPAMSRTIADGWSFSYEHYIGATRVAERWRLWLAGASDGCDGILTPATNGEAPKGLGSTGDASFQEIWSLLRVPTITLPWTMGRSGLPVGVQLVGRHLADEALLRLAKWVAQGNSISSIRKQR